MDMPPASRASAHDLPSPAQSPLVPMRRRSQPAWGKNGVRRERRRYGSSRWRAICSQVSVTWPSASMISKVISISPLSSQPSPRGFAAQLELRPSPPRWGRGWSGLGLVLPGLLDDGGAVEAIDLLEERARVEVGRGHRAFDDLLVLEDALELVPLGEGADADALIRAVVHVLHRQ